MENKVHRVIIVATIFVALLSGFCSSPLTAARHCVLVDSLSVLDSSLHSVSHQNDGVDSLPPYVPLDSLARLDSIRVADSLWFAGLTKKQRKAVIAERKEKEMEAKMLAKIAKADSLDAIKTAKKALRDSIIQATPRVLETYIIPDSLKYKRMIFWTRDRMFNDITIAEIDTSYNDAFFDYPAFKKDVNATYLGVIGSPTQSFNFFKRSVTPNAFFYSNYEDNSFNAETLPQYNTKSPYTQFDYTGTLLNGREKEEANIRILTSTNITPALNMTLAYQKYGAVGQLLHETVDNRTAFAALNHVGKRYVGHIGYIFNSVKASENGGMTDPRWIRDTTLNDSHEVPVRLSDAKSVTKKHTVYLDQSYRLPFLAVKDYFEGLAQKRREVKEARRARLNAPVDTSFVARDSSLRYTSHQNDEGLVQRDSSLHSVSHQNDEGLVQRDSSLRYTSHQNDGDYSGGSFYVGHNSELSVFRRIYEDKVTAGTKYNPYENFYINPSVSHDSLRVLRLDNKVYVRLQPWKEDFAISKLDVGVGDKYTNYFITNPAQTFLSKKRNVGLNTFYVYAGARGQVKKYFEWDAQMQYNLIGYGANDFFVKGNLKFSFYPFRQRNEPISLIVSAGTNLREPDYYEQHFFTNHYKWDNNFGKISTTNFGGALEIPKWKLNIKVDYALLNNNLYFDTKGVIQQNPQPMSVLTAALEKNFVIWKFHLDNRALLQFSSNQDVIPLPVFAMNLRYYLQFTVVKNAMDMQIGANMTFNTLWHAPAYNPVTATFISQNEFTYGNNPIFDVFINIQWKRCCIFIKCINVGNGSPAQHPDYFSASGFISPMRTFKVGIHWPFYVWQGKHSHSHGSSNSGGASLSKGSSGAGKGLRQMK